RLLEEVHGNDDQAKGRTRGWRIKDAHQWLRSDPPKLLIGRLIDLYVHSLELREIEREIAEARDGIAEEGEADRLIALKQAQSEKRALNEQDRTALDEEVRNYRGSNAA